ncbi:hypothetical protein PMG71_00545 [Roseofilum sp. BLCC_M154]|uniref:Uncharacterized protein n=1 Tax=Roseofilum acuticapitatum BLCC-M154 TaxID=3022444 RepID=A0ABT7ALY0_9CYAN|nr:hypothetical protein [Roseofilum acuticapitatum]MDJ1167909.1 hypothetical protein [Roseofilum acuticapitatum BLCC-M154]
MNDLQKIYDTLRCLPSDELYQPDLMTPDQKEYWFQLRSMYELQAEAWKSSYLVKGYYPLDEKVDRREITQQKQALFQLSVQEIHARLKLFNALYTRLEQANTILDRERRKGLSCGLLIVDQMIKSVTPNTDFNSGCDLLIQSLIDDANSDFKDSLHYSSFSKKKWSDMCVFFTKYLEDYRLGRFSLSQQFKQELRRQTSHLHFSKPGVTFSSLLQCSLLSLVDRDFKSKFNQYIPTVVEAVKVASRASRKVRSYEWHHGILKQGCKQCGTYH